MKDALRHPMNTEAARLYPALSSEQGDSYQTAAFISASTGCERTSDTCGHNTTPLYLVTVVDGNFILQILQAYECHQSSESF